MNQHDPNQSTPNDDQRGLRCRGCGFNKSNVIYTREASRKTLMRRRECRKCGKRVTTFERQFGEP